MSEIVRRPELSSEPLRLVQITDTHLNRREGGALLGLNTDFSLQHVINLVLKERSAIDVLLATGDISDQGSKEAYLRALDYFRQLPTDNTLWLAGNHDLLQHMQEVLGSDGKLTRALYAGSWQIVMLNSQIPGEVGGCLGEEELQWLESCLQEAAANNVYSLVCLHHQPVPMGSAWIDQQQVSDCDAFFAVIDRFPLVRGVLWGHVHQQLDVTRNDVQLMSTPSSCIQFAPASDDFAVDDAPPGYRWLDLYADGRIETSVSRVQGVEFSVDLESQGYV